MSVEIASDLQRRTQIPGPDSIKLTTWALPVAFNTEHTDSRCTVCIIGKTRQNVQLKAMSAVLLEQTSQAPIIGQSYAPCGPLHHHSELHPRTHSATGSGRTMPLRRLTKVRQ